MKEYNYAREDVKGVWKVFLIWLSVTFVFFILIELNTITMTDALCFPLFWLSFLIALYKLADAVIVSINHHLFPSLKHLLIGILIFIAMPMFYCYQSGLFWGKSILTGIFIDTNQTMDIDKMDIRFFKNGKYIVKEDWFFWTIRYVGTYHKNKDTFELSVFPPAAPNSNLTKVIRENDKIFFPDTANHYDTSYLFFKIISTENH